MSGEILSLVAQVRALIFTSIIGCPLFTSDIPPDFPVTSPTEQQWFLASFTGHTFASSFFFKDRN